MNTVAEENEYNRRMIVKGVKINYPIRDQENMIMVLERETGLPVFLDRRQDFNGKIHMKIPATVAPVEAAPDVAPEELTDTPENKAKWDALNVKKDELSFAKLSKPEKDLYGKLKPLYGKTK